MTPRDDGFTLIEVLVSLAIFSLAILGLNRAATLAVSGTASLQTSVRAGFVADNAVALTRMQPIEIGTQRSVESMAGQVFEVVVETSETEVGGFYEIAARVTEEDRERVVATRRGFIYGSRTIVSVETEGDAP